MLSGSNLEGQAVVRNKKYYPKPSKDSHLSVPCTLDQSRRRTHIKFLAKGLAFHLDKLLPHLISQHWAVFVKECKTSGNLRQLSMSLSSLMLLKHCYIITVELGKTFVVWNKTQKTWNLTKFRCKDDIFWEWNVFSNWSGQFHRPALSMVSSQRPESQKRVAQITETWAWYVNI